MAGGVDDDIVPFFGFEKHPRRVNGNALGLFVLKCVQQKGIFERPAVAAAGLFDLFKFAVRQGTGIRQQATDDRTLAMINMPGDNDVHIFGLICHIC